MAQLLFLSPSAYRRRDRIVKEALQSSTSLMGKVDQVVAWITMFASSDDLSLFPDGVRAYVVEAMEERINE